MIKPIETPYKGYRFRSRLEARWAVFFDALNIKWEYEKEGFDLGDGDYYLPDFWLPELSLWYEVKGVLDQRQGGVNLWNRHCVTYPELSLAEKFRSEQEYPCAVAVGQVGEEEIYFFAHDMTDSSGGSFDSRMFWCMARGVPTLRAERLHSQRVIWTTDFIDPLPHFLCNYDVGFDTTLIQQAQNIAKSARFEHGENPNIQSLRRK